MTADDGWLLQGFETQFDQWIEREGPSDDIRLIVLAWLLSRMDDPYRGMRRDPGGPNLWFGRIPASSDSDGQVVVCSYWISEGERLVRCNSISTLNPPF